MRAISSRSAAFSRSGVRELLLADALAGGLEEARRGARTDVGREQDLLEVGRDFVVDELAAREQGVQPGHEAAAGSSRGRRRPLARLSLGAPAALLLLAEARLPRLARPARPPRAPRTSASSRSRCRRSRSSRSASLLAAGNPPCAAPPPRLARGAASSGRAGTCARGGARPAAGASRTAAAAPRPRGWLARSISADGARGRAADGGAARDPDRADDDEQDEQDDVAIAIQSFGVSD